MRSPTNTVIKRRLEGTFVGLMALFFALSARLVWIQGVQHEHFLQKAREFHDRTLTLPAPRGVIQDRRGRELVTNVEAKTLICNPRAVVDKVGTAQKVAACLGGDPERYLKKLSRDRWPNGKPIQFAYLARAADRKRVDALMAMKLPGLEAQAEQKRVHPAGPLAAQVTGCVNIDNQPQEGAEKKFEHVLKGKDGERRTEVDAINRPIPDADQFFRPPVSGGSVKLSLDSTIQEFCEAELRKIMETFRPEGATAIVMETRTGEILAMANAPTCDPNDRGAPPITRRNRAIQDLYEPGSTFKTLTIAEAVQENLSDRVVNCGGSLAIGKHVIRCAHQAVHGRVGLHEIEQHSCNIGAATIGLRLGPRSIYHAIERFGFLKKTGIELPGEERGSVGGMKPEDWPRIKTATVAFGQGVVVTPLSILCMYQAIANDGVRIPPTIVASINGKPYHRPDPTRRVLRSDVARTLNQYMRSVVVGKGGTGHNAKIPHYNVAGKTGTAQLVKNGHYVHGAYVSSFIGFLPASRPRIAILVTATNPTQKGTYGGTVAAPSFREIARQTMAYLHIPPDAPEDYRDGAGDKQLATFARWDREHGGAETAETTKPVIDD